ncbi:MAG TPA: hypothetical protein VGP70_20440 [Actinomadura sp.]|jgi:hypothetical protein|nr:hypothetical protein [Actinomadura sp.]
MRPVDVGRAAALVAAGLALSGCSLFGGGSGGGNQQIPKAEIGPDDHVKGAVAKAVQPAEGKDVYVDILSLKRHDTALRLVFAVTPRARGNSAKLAKESFGGSMSTPHAGGAYLVDLENLREYEHLTIGQGDEPRCACSAIQGDGFALDEPTVLYVDFPAPPDSVQKITVVMPIVGPMPGVRIG